MCSSKPKKKIHVLQVVGDPVGGIRKHVHSIIEGLDAAGFIQSYAYSINCTDVKFELDLERLTLKTKCVIPLLIKKRPGLKDLTNLRILVNYVRAAKVDVIHGHGAKGGLYARIVARVCGIQSVYTPHGGVAHNMFSRTENALYTSVEKLLYGRTDCFVFESNYTAQAFHKKIGRNSGCWFVNYNGVSIPDVEDLKDQAVKVGKDPCLKGFFHVGVFGLLRMQKGQEYAIRAVAQLNNKNKSVCLHIYGDGPDREMLESLAKSNGVSETVIFYGDVTDVDAHMNRMDVILIPSLFESFGYVAVEAMALGKPVIASSVGGLKEVVSEETGMLVPPGNVDEIEKALMLCMKEPELLREKSMRGRGRVESEFSLDRMVGRISTVYQDLVRSASAQ